uniref:Putative phd finger protein 21a n=1 Tax=Rhipicephalus pulchellus TaxID=72859 RepID=L7LXW4_RHIPC
MELQTLQSQLKSAIQNHQIVLSKMRIDPQNSALQRQLHDLQAEILTLSEQQKQVVQQLRTELERKQNSAVLKLSHNAQLLPRGVLGGTGVPVKLQAALKGGPGGVLLPQVVVVPSCSGPPHGSPTLLAPSIRVPQYPPCGQRLTPQQPLVQAQHQQPQHQQPQQQHPQQQQHQQSQQQHALVATAPPVPRVPKSCVAVLVQASSINSTAAGLMVPNLGTNVVQSNTHAATTTTAATNGICGTGATTTVTVTAATPAPVPTASVAPPRKNVPVGPPPPSAPPPTKEDHQKLELLGALGLMTREALRELQHRRGERKRRTTANPHFSSAALEEKRRNALLLIGENMASGRKCQKVRSRLGSSTPSSPEASSNETTPNGHPSPPPCCDVTTKREEAPVLVNGDVLQSWTKNTPDDQVTNNSLGWVSDYTLLKSAKAEEKQKLLKRSLELKAERMQLEAKKQQLSEIIANQQKRRLELQLALQNVQNSLEKFERVVKLFKEGS